MTKRSVALIGIILALAAVSFAQSVAVTPRKVVYRRPHPISPYKKKFTITYPRVKAATPAVARKIEAVIDPVKVLDIKLKDEISDTQWLEEAGFEVAYNKNSILAVTLSANGTAAYPDGYERYVIVNSATGMRVKPADVFTDLAGLAAKVKEKQKAEIATAIVDVKKDDPETTDPASLFESTDFTVKDLEQFTVSDTGVTFIYDYGFPHVIEALQPEGHYAFTWAELKPFIKQDGSFGRWSR